MHILDDVNYEIAVLRRNITDTYNASTEASARADFVAAAVLLEAADDLQSELRAALDFRADLLSDVPCDTCDGDQCSNCYYEVSVSVDPTDMDQSYQLDVLLNELSVFGAQVEYQQDEIDYLQEELADAEEAIDYWVGEAERNSDAQSDYDNLLSIFKALQIDYSNLEKTLFSERASFDKANDLLHDDIIDLQMKLRETERRLYDTSERAADYWKRLKSAEAES